MCRTRLQNGIVPARGRRNIRPHHAFSGGGWLLPSARGKSPPRFCRFLRLVDPWILALAERAFWSTRILRKRGSGRPGGRPSAGTGFPGVHKPQKPATIDPHLASGAAACRPSRCERFRPIRSCCERFWPTFFSETRESTGQKRSQQEAIGQKCTERIAAPTGFARSRPAAPTCTQPRMRSKPLNSCALAAA